MKFYLLVFVVTVLSVQCEASLLKGFLSGTVEINSQIHDAAHGVADAILGGVSQVLNHHHRPPHRHEKPETVVVVVEEDGPNDGPPGPGYGRPTQNGYDPPVYDNRPPHKPGHHQQQGHYGQHGNQGQNYNQNGNGNHNNQYGNPGNQYGKPNNQYGNPNNQYGKPNQQHDNPDNQYGKPNNQYENPGQYGNNNNPYNKPHNQYGHQDHGNNGNVHNKPNNQYGNQNNQHGKPNRPYGTPNNQYGNNNNNYGNTNNQNQYPNNQNGNPGNQNGNFNNQFGNPGNQDGNFNNQFGKPNQNSGYNNRPTSEKPYQGEFQDQSSYKPEVNKPFGSTTKAPTGSYGYSNQKPNNNGANFDENSPELSTKKPIKDDEYPLFVPLGPNDYVYGGDKIQVNAPKRETDNSKPTDEDEDLPLDVRIKNP